MVQIFYQQSYYVIKIRKETMKKQERKPKYGIPVFEILFCLIIALPIIILPILFGLYILIIILCVCVGFFILLRGLFILVGSTHSSKIKMRAKIISIVQPKDDAQVLDVGTGAGLLAIGFAKATKNGKVVGVDIWSQRSMLGSKLETAVRNAEVEGVKSRVEFKTGDARNLPFPDGHFDIVVASMVIHTIRKAEDKRKALSEMVRVLKPRGKFAIMEPGSPAFWSNKKLTIELERFDLVEVRFHQYRRKINIICAIKSK